MHRDLKPGNVMLTATGVKLLDFGLAKISPPSGLAAASTIVLDEGPLTTDGVVMGTWQYMAPEQLEGKDADARSDIFAFGAVIHEMATGKRAFDGESQASVIAAVLERDPPSVLSLQPGVPGALDRLVRKCLAKNPEQRWQTTRDLVDELRWIDGERRQARPVDAARPAGARTLPWAWLTAVATSAAVASGDRLELPAAGAGNQRAGSTLFDSSSRAGCAERFVCTFSRWPPCSVSRSLG